MKFLVVLALAVACARADVSHVDAAAEVLKYSSDVHAEGFNFGYETSNGISASSSGVVKDPNSEYPSQEVQGQYQYVGPDGVTYSVIYKADENGFQPQGAHLPVAPPVPEDIARSLEYNAKFAAKVVSEPFVQVAKAVAPVFKPQTPYKPQAFKKF